MHHYNFISFPVSYSHFSDIQKSSFNNKTKILNAAKALYKRRNFSQVELNHPYIQIESRLFVHFFISLQNQNAQNIEMHLRMQLALLFLMESIFVTEKYQNIKNLLVDIKKFFDKVVMEILSNGPLPSVKIKTALAEVFSDREIAIFFSILKNNIKENIFNFKIFRNWNKDEFPMQYRPLITDIAELLSEIAIFEHREDFSNLFAKQSSLNPYAWFKEKIVTESMFLMKGTSISKNPNEIELEERSSLLQQVV